MVITELKLSNKFLYKTKYKSENQVKKLNIFEKDGSGVILFVNGILIR
jgi:hypothetical protein